MSGRDIVFVTVPGKDLDLWFWPCHMIGGEKRLSNAVENRRNSEEVTACPLYGMALWQLFPFRLNICRLRSMLTWTTTCGTANGLQIMITRVFDF
jgi:hypothetical protein